MRTQLIVGVAGGSGAGKHLVIHDHLVPNLETSVQIIEHDWYYYDFEHLYRAQGVRSRADINYDRPEAYENALLAEHLRSLRAGRPVDIHCYQKGIGLRATKPIQLEPAEVVILDGMMLLAVPEVVSLIEIGAYVHANDRVRLDRRVRRDMEFSSVDESVIRFQRDVLPAHHRFVQPSASRARFILDNSQDGRAPGGVNDLIECVRRTLGNGRQDSFRTGGCDGS